MSRSKEDVTSETVEPTERLPAGKVEFDSRGNSVWRWAREALDSTSLLLKRLENKDLALEPTQKVPVVRADAKKADRGKRGAPNELSVVGGKRDGGGFDPYNSGR